MYFLTIQTSSTTTIMLLFPLQLPQEEDHLVFSRASKRNQLLITPSPGQEPTQRNVALRLVPDSVQHLSWILVHPKFHPCPTSPHTPIHLLLQICARRVVVVQNRFQVWQNSSTRVVDGVITVIINSYSGMSGQLLHLSRVHSALQSMCTTKNLFQ